MTSSGVRVRFAPSPTGYLHVGGARTALFNWLFARKMGGRFLLRIEDTDRERSSDEHTQVILDGLEWLGLDYDDEIAFQGAGLERHRALADRLVGEGKAYMDEGAVRFRMPTGEIAWDDGVHGHISFDGSDIEDWVILRSDRTPTYNFSVVADDVTMGITHIIRGSDHISNTPKQIAVYRAMEREQPSFSHVSVIHGMDGKKLSKRHGATAVGDYRKSGILPEAMRNFLALLGWSPGDDRELFFEMADLVAAFSLQGLQKKSAIFDTTKLEWMNGQYLSRTPPETLLPLVEPHLSDYDLPQSKLGRERLLSLIAVVRERARTTLDIAWQIAVRTDVKHMIKDDKKAQKLFAKDPDGFRTVLALVHDRLHNVDESSWAAEPLESDLRALAEAHGLGVGQVFQPIRVAVTGGAVSEPVNVLLSVVGREESLARIEAASHWESPAVLGS